uniref:Uncharacterized protein n=1 Tax=Anguilla anguilla TaxID=7936 RepID=A0A0E9XDH4_ANGAN
MQIRLVCIKQTCYLLKLHY